MTIPRDRRFNATRPCPACGHGKGNSWCFILPPDKEGHISFWCPRQEFHGGMKGRENPNKSKGGWFHDMTPRDRCGQRGPAPSPRPTLRAFVEPVEHPDFAKLAKRFTRAMTPGSLEHLAAKLGLHARVLQSLGVGWVTAEELAELNTSCKTDGAWTFPMSDVVADKVVITGIRLRTVDGFKYAVAGSDGSGLFVPRNYRQYRGSMLLLPEGPTSCAALIQLGFYAVGRPNNRAGVSHLQRLARLLNPSRIVVVGDNDQKPDCTWPGLEGAEFIAGEFQQYCKDVRILLPPDGIKDARKWLHGGARVVDVSNAIVTGQGVAA